MTKASWQRDPVTGRMKRPEETKEAIDDENNVNKKKKSVSSLAMHTKGCKGKLAKGAKLGKRKFQCGYNWSKFEELNKDSDSDATVPLEKKPTYPPQSSESESEDDSTASGEDNDSQSKQNN